MRHCEKHVDNLLSNPRRALLSMSVPLMLAILVENLQTFIDGVWCSGLSSDALSAISMTSCIYTMIVALGTGISVGASATIARHIGTGDGGSAEKVIPATIVLILGMSVACSLVFWFLGEPIVRFIGADGNVSMCLEYLHPYLLMSFFLMMNSVWAGILRAEGDSTFCLFISVIAAVVNIVLDPVLIYVFDLGLTGAAWATCVSYVIVTALGFWYYLSGRTYVRMVFSGFRFEKPVFKDICAVGVPCALEMFVAPLLVIPQNAIVYGCGGTVGLVAYTYAFKFIDIALIPANAISKSLIPIISVDIGQRRPDKIAEAVRMTYRVTLVIGAFCLLFIMVFADLLVGAFMNSDSMLAVHDDLALALRIFSLTCVFHTCRLVGTAILQATRRALLASVLTLIREFLFLGLFWAASFFSMTAIYWSCDITNFTMMFVITLFAMRSIRKLTSEMGMEGFQLFGRARTRRYRRSKGFVPRSPGESADAYGGCPAGNGSVGSDLLMEGAVVLFFGIVDDVRPVQDLDDIRFDAVHVMDDIGSDHILRLPVGVDLPFAEHDHPVREPGRDVEVVADDENDDASPVGDVPEESHRVDLMIDIQVGRGLVEHQELRLLGEASGDHHPLMLAGGELVEHAHGVIVYVHLDKAVRSDIDVLLGHSVSGVRIPPHEDGIHHRHRERLS